VAKNRRADRGEFWLELDREHHSVREVSDPSSNPEAIAADATRERSANRAKVDRDAAALAKVLSGHPEGLTERGLRAAVTLAGHKWGVNRLDAARACLSEGRNGSRLVDATPDAMGCLWKLQPIEGGERP
jgi:hypothetical protein